MSHPMPCHQLKSAPAYLQQRYQKPEREKIDKVNMIIECLHSIEKRNSVFFSSIIRTQSTDLCLK